MKSIGKGSGTVKKGGVKAQISEIGGEKIFGFP